MLLDDGFPDDWHGPPSAQGDGFPDDWHVPPSAEGDGFPDDWHVPPSAEGGGFPDDWHVPPSAQGDGFPDDWYVPASAMAPRVAQPAPSPPPGVANWASFDRPAQSDSWAVLSGTMPASRLSPVLAGMPPARTLGLDPPAPPFGTPALPALGLFGPPPPPAGASLLRPFGGVPKPSLPSLFGGVATPTPAWPPAEQESEDDDED